MKTRIGLLWAVAAAISLCSPLRAEASPSGAASGADLLLRQKIKHLVFIIQENRSFDSYFGTFPGAAGFPHPLPCLPSHWYPSECFSPYLEHKANQLGGPYSSSYQELDIDGGKMDGFIYAREKELNHSKCNPHNQALGGAGAASAQVEVDDDEVGPYIAPCTQDVMSYHDATDLPNYWAYASNFVLLDHFFESVHSQSHPSHLEIFSGWAARCSELDPPVVSSCYSEANPGDVWGPHLPEPYLWTDITYLLYQHGVSWNVYLDGGLASLHGRTGSSPLWDVLPGFETVQEDGQVGNATVNQTQFFEDAEYGTLPQVSWILPKYNDSEHPQANIYEGMRYTTGLVNAIAKGPDWDSTAIFIMWDDMGGFYDRMAPPVTFDTLGLGIRVPSLLISAYARSRYIDHQICSSDCYLKLIEDDFLNGQRMSQSGRPDPRPDYRDEQPEYGDLVNDFDFTQPARQPLVLSTHPMSLLR